MAVYSSGSQLEWREVEGGELPSPRSELRATLVGDLLFVTGGFDGPSPRCHLGEDGNRLTSILSWDPVGETWQAAGDLAVARYYHAAVALPSSLVECGL